MCIFANFFTVQCLAVMIVGQYVALSYCNVNSFTHHMALWELPLIKTNGKHHYDIFWVNISFHHNVLNRDIFTTSSTLHGVLLYEIDGGMLKPVVAWWKPQVMWV